MVGWFKLNSFIYLLYVEQSVWTGPYADISLDADAVPTSRSLKKGKVPLRDFWSKLVPFWSLFQQFGPFFENLQMKIYIYIC